MKNKKELDLKTISYKELCVLYGNTKVKTEQDKKLLDDIMNRIKELSDKENK